MAEEEFSKHTQSYGYSVTESQDQLSQLWKEEFRESEREYYKRGDSRGRCETEGRTSCCEGYETVD